MDDNQIEVPPSFAALFTSPSGHRLTEPMATVRTRYELCEDMAQMLAEQAATALFKSGGSEREVLAKMEQALGAEGAVLEPREARWVVTRLAEILGWEPPADPSAGG
ncbi:hypothetical protein H8N03_22840 [Ramlibacter sp. USB13]|uniref:ATPase with chaperone activity n=1 Tax=Ramlibacter cellulosilyticus TaxID=2764187 RepID=A0A923MUT3_9BURK|nr:hypothetical protein [Ramlibacter cellulosilyticus]MBC5785795.1 hypothetical protein [Ramlibacter cellulosilyticus]